MSAPLDDAVNPVTAEAGDTGESQGTTSINPAWEPVLSILPEKLHETVTGHFRQWDDNYRKVEAELTELRKSTVPREASPLDEFKDVPVEDIRAALGITQTIASDPRRVAELMADQLGLSLSEKKELEKELKKEAPKIEFDDDDDPRLKQMYETIEEQKRLIAESTSRQEQAWNTEVERQQNLLREQEETRANDQVTAEINQLFQKHPEAKGIFEQWNQEIFFRASQLVSTGDKTPLLTAYTELSNRLDSVKSSIAPKSTPLFVPTGGQAPPASETANKSTRERALEMLTAMQAQGQG